MRDEDESGSTTTTIPDAIMVMTNKIALILYSTNCINQFDEVGTGKIKLKALTELDHPIIQSCKTRKRDPNGIARY